MEIVNCCLNRNRLTDLEKETMVPGIRGEDGGRDSKRVWEYTLLYLKWITDKDLLHSTCNSAQCYVATWMGGEFGGEWIYVYVWLSPFTAHLKLSQHYHNIVNTPIQNKKFLKKQITNKNLQCSTGNSTQCSVVT